MTKFAKTFGLSEEAVKGKRGSIVESQAKNELKKLINEKEGEISGKEMQLEDLNDIMPEDTTSLKLKNFDAVRWAKDNASLRLDLMELRIELKDLNDLYAEWFSDDEPKAE